MKIFIFFLFISLFFSSNSYFTMPFYTEKISDNTTEENFILNYMNTGLYSKIKIGSNSQELPVLINLISYESYIINSTVNYNGPKYNIKESSSYIEGKRLNFFMNDIIKYGSKSYDLFDLGEIKIQNFTFTLASSFQNNSLIREGGQIGLGVINLHTSGDDSFIRQLNDLKIIKHYPFSITYTKEDEGNLIFGEYLHDIKNYQYNKEDMMTIQLVDIDNEFFWTVSSKFKVDNNTMDFYQGFIINSQYGFNFAYSEYSTYISPFLKDKISNGKCKEKEIYIEGIFPDLFNEQNYYYYVCDEDVDLKNFPSLIVEIEGNKFQIEFTYKDLWVKFKGKNYLNVLLNNYIEATSGFYFSFGRMFLKKYDLTFDTERRIIGIYNKKKNTKTNWKLLTIVVFIILIVILFFLFRFIFRYYQMKNSKKTAHELTEDGFYQLSD